MTSDIFFNAKAGVAYVMNRYHLDHIFDNLKVANLTVKNHTFRPKFAVGADYHFNDNIALGLAYEITSGHGKPAEIPLLTDPEPSNSHYAPLIQFASVNLKYSF